LCKWEGKERGKEKREFFFKNLLHPCHCIRRGEEYAQCRLTAPCLFFGRKGNGFGSDPTWVMTVMIMMIK
jgi:hypothetical protein